MPPRGCRGSWERLATAVVLPRTWLEIVHLDKAGHRKAALAKACAHHAVRADGALGVQSAALEGRQGGGRRAGWRRAMPYGIGSDSCSRSDLPLSASTSISLTR